MFNFPSRHRAHQRQSNAEQTRKGRGLRMQALALLHIQRSHALSQKQQGTEQPSVLQHRDTQHEAASALPSIMHLLRSRIDQAPAYLSSVAHATRSALRLRKSGGDGRDATVDAGRAGGLGGEKRSDEERRGMIDGGLNATLVTGDLQTCFAVAESVINGSISLKQRDVLVAKVEAAADAAEEVGHHREEAEFKKGIVQTGGGAQGSRVARSDVF